jgi:hypothetical protein
MQGFQLSLDIQHQIKEVLLQQLPAEVNTKETIESVSKALFDKFGPTDTMTSPFQQTIFWQAGTNLTYFRRDSGALKNRNTVYHFKFYDLENPAIIGEFSLSTLEDGAVLNSKSKFSDYLKKQLASIRDLAKQ